MAQIKVMGHCPPDTDSTCSPIAYAWFLKTYKSQNAEAYIGGTPNREADFVLNYFKVMAPTQIEAVTAEDKLVLIDTNNPEELIAGWDQAQIVEIVDHHKLYGLKTANIPDVTIRSYGCVATVLWEIMSNAKAEIPKEIAGLMVACILSDTLKLTSPTTTDTDRKAVDELSRIAELNVDSFAAEMFAAKSNLDGLSAKDILSTDAKDFDFGGKIFKLAVLETTNPEQALGKRAELETEMNAVKLAENLAGFMFFIVDILKSQATLLIPSESEAEIAKKAFKVEKDATGVFVLPGVVSRKKQIVPVIEASLI